MKRAKLNFISCLILSTFGITAPCLAGTDAYAPFMKGPPVQVLPGDSPACRSVKELQIKQYGMLQSAQSKPCAPGKEASCAALISTLNDLCAATNQKIVSTCISPWMMHAAGL